MLRKLQLLSRKTLCVIWFNLSENCGNKLCMLLMTYQLHEASCHLYKKINSFNAKTGINSNIKRKK